MLPPVLIGGFTKGHWAKGAFIVLRRRATQELSLRLGMLTPCGAQSAGMGETRGARRRSTPG